VNSALWNSEDLWSNWEPGHDVPARSYHWENVNWTDERQYARPGDARRWMTINFWLWWHTRSYVESALYNILSMTIYETSNWMLRCRYMYRLPCCTEYNPDNYWRDYNANFNAEYNDVYNTEYNAISVIKWHYYPEWDPDSDSAIPSYTATLTIDDCNRLPNQALPIDIPYEAIWDQSPAKQRLLKEGDDPTGIATATANNYQPASAGMIHRKIHSPIGNASSVKCTWTWID